MCTSYVYLGLRGFTFPAAFLTISRAFGFEAEGGYFEESLWFFIPLFDRNHTCCLF